MSTRSRTTATAPAPARRARGARAGAPCAAGAIAAVAGRGARRRGSSSRWRWPSFHHAVREIALPLRHEDIIRQQARDKGLDPALIAGVIYAESHFRDGQTLAPPAPRA